jgi:hypothetical protein
VPIGFYNSGSSSGYQFRPPKIFAYPAPTPLNFSFRLIGLIPSPPLKLSSGSALQICCTELRFQPAQIPKNFRSGSISGSDLFKNIGYSFQLRIRSLSWHSAGAELKEYIRYFMAFKNYVSS